MENSETCCGFCCWFHSQSDRYGQCRFRPGEAVRCDECCTADGNYVSRQTMRHYLAVLLQANRYRRDNNVPSCYKMPRPTEIGEAIDFAYKYIKTYSAL